MAMPKKAEADKYQKMSISFTPAHIEMLISYCQRNERSISWVIRKALDDWFEKHKDDTI